MPSERNIYTMLERVRPLLGAYPDIMLDYLYYRSEVEFQKDRLDQAELKALKRFDQLLLKHGRWIYERVYISDLLAEAREEFDPDHWWWYLNLS